MFDDLRANAERAHLRTSGGRAAGLAGARAVGRNGLEALLRSPGYRRCASLARGGARRRRRRSGRRRGRLAPRGANEMPGLMLHEFDAAAHLWHRSRRLGALDDADLPTDVTNTMRRGGGLALPTLALLDNDMFDMRTFRFYEPSPKNLHRVRISLKLIHLNGTRIGRVAQAAGHYFAASGQCVTLCALYWS